MQKTLHVTLSSSLGLKIHAPSVGIGDMGKEAPLDQVFLASPPLPLTRKWDLDRRTEVNKLPVPGGESDTVQVFQGKK